MKPETYPFVARPLPYEYYALAPVLHMETLTYHHDRHYKTYVDNLNAALSDYPELQKMSLKELLLRLEELPAAVQTSIRNNGGGTYNHELYFDSMRAINEQNRKISEKDEEMQEKVEPVSKEENRNAADPMGALADAIDRDFGSYKGWKEKMKEAAVTKFGSGWAWLVSDVEGKLSIVQTANQDVPDFAVYAPIFLVDVWEHAYYLQYQNKRADYVEGWFGLINWRKALKRYEEREQFFQT